MRTPKLRTDSGIIEIPEGWLEEDELPKIRRKAVVLAEGVEKPKSYVRIEPPSALQQGKPRPVSVHGVTYRNIRAAAAETGIKYSSLWVMLQNRNLPDVRYLWEVEV